MIVYLSYPTFTLHAFFMHKHGAAGSGNGGLTVIFHYVNYTQGIWMFTDEKKSITLGVSKSPPWKSRFLDAGSSEFLDPMNRVAVLLW